MARAVAIVEDDAGIRDNLVASLNGSSGYRCVAGCFFKEIADRLGISSETVRTWRHRIPRRQRDHACHDERFFRAG